MRVCTALLGIVTNFSLIAVACLLGIAYWPSPQETMIQTTVCALGIAPQVAQVRGAVVHISKDNSCEVSGCLITPDGILFTAKHVSNGEPGDYVVTLDNGKQYSVKYVIEDRENDIALMQLDLNGQEPNLPWAPLACEDTMRVGDALFIFGSPLGKNNINTVSLGILSAINRDLYNRDGWQEYRQYQWHAMIQTTSPAFPGNSGGPVFNIQGEVIGVLVAGQGETLNFSVPVARFRDTIEAVRQWFNLCRFETIVPSMRGPQGPPGPQGPQGPPAPEPNETDTYGENK